MVSFWSLFARFVPGSAGFLTLLPLCPRIELLLLGAQERGEHERNPHSVSHETTWTSFWGPDPDWTETAPALLTYVHTDPSAAFRSAHRSPFVRRACALSKIYPERLDRKPLGRSARLSRRRLTHDPELEEQPPRRRGGASMRRVALRPFRTGPRRPNRAVDREGAGLVPAGRGRASGLGFRAVLHGAAPSSAAQYPTRTRTMRCLKRASRCPSCTPSA